MDSLSFSLEMYHILKESFDIEDDFIRLDHVYNKTGIPEILSEGTTGILDSITKFFKDLLDKTKEFFKQVIMYISSHLMELDKFVDKYGDRLKNLKVKFKMKGYKYSIPKDNFPNLSPLEDVVASYNSDLTNLNKTKVDIGKEKEEYLSDKNLDSLRGIIMGETGPVSEEDFKSDIKKKLRSGESEEQDMVIDGLVVSRIASTSKDLVKAKSEAKKLQVKLETLMTKIITFFDKKAKVYTSGNGQKVEKQTISITDNKFSNSDKTEADYTVGTEETINLLLQFKYSQSKELSTMISTVATEKVSALEEQVKFYKKIVQTALFKPESNKLGDE